MNAEKPFTKLNIAQLTRLFLIAVVYIIVFIAGAVPAFADITANESMRLSRTEGTVTLCNQNSKNLSIVNNMKLLDGYRIETAAASYAWLTLDDTKAVKIDAMSCMEISQSGKQLELRVMSGSILVNANRHLEADETLNIRTSTMVVGIRGTSVVVRVIGEDHSQIQLLEGSTEIQAADPVTGQVKSSVITSGQTADTYVYDQTKAGDRVDIVINKVTEENIAPFAAVELSENAVMKERIEANTELNVQQIITESSSKLESEQQAVNAELSAINTESAVQSVSLNAQPSAQTAVSEMQTPVMTLQSDSLANVSSVFAAEESSESSAQAASGGDSEGGQASTELIILTMPVSAGTIQDSLNTYKNVTLTGGGTFTLASGEQLNVPAGKTFTVNSGTGFQVAAGGDLWIWGHMEVPDGMTSNGSVHNMSSNTLVTSLVNNGTFENKGRIDGTVQNAGTFTSDTYNGESTGLVTGNFLNSGILIINDGQLNNVTVKKYSSSDSPSFTLNGGSVSRLTLVSYTEAVCNGGSVDDLEAKCGSNSTPELKLSGCAVGTLNVSMPESPVTIESGSVSELQIDDSGLKMLNIYDGAEVKLTAEQVENFSGHISYFDDTQTEYCLDNCPFWGFDGTIEDGYLDYKAVPHTLMWVVDSAGTEASGNTVDSVLLNSGYGSGGSTISAYSAPDGTELKSPSSGKSVRHLTVDLNGRDLNMGSFWYMTEGVDFINSKGADGSRPKLTVNNLTADADCGFSDVKIRNGSSDAEIWLFNSSALTFTGCTYDYTTVGKLSGSGSIELNDTKIINGTFSLPAKYEMTVSRDSSISSISVAENAVLESSGTITSLTNDGTVEINDGGIIKGTGCNNGQLIFKNGKSEISGSLTNNYMLTVEDDAEVSIGTSQSVKNAEDGCLNLDGTVTGSISNDGQLYIHGTVSTLHNQKDTVVYSDGCISGHLDNRGELTNYGEISGETFNFSTIYNYGTLSNIVENYGEIKDYTVNSLSSVNAEDEIG